MFRYWGINHEFEPWNSKGLDFIMPSDSTLRKDLKDLEKLDYISAQINKEDYENIQRKDKKLREENEKKKKK